MNKKEAIEKIKNIDTLNINDRVAGQQVELVIKNEVLDIISQIDEPVEKEKLYTVEIPNPNLNAHVVLQKTGDGLVLVTVGNAGWAEWESSKLTEAEIKEDFEWAWQWAVPVEVE